MNREDCFFLGKIVKTTGLKGQVVLLIEADEPTRYNELESVFVELNKQLVPFFIEEISVKTNGRAYVKFKGVDSLEAAEKLKKSDTWLPAALLEELDDRGYYFHELPGLALCDENGAEHATITNVVDTGTHYLAQLKYKGKEAWFPLNDELFIRIERFSKKILFKIPEGLLDIYIDPNAHVNDEQ